MNGIHRTFILALAMAVALTAGGTTTLAKGSRKSGTTATSHRHKGAGKTEQRARGTVTAVDGKSITVQTKKGKAKQFQITSSTTFEKKGGKKHGKQVGAKQTAGSKPKKAGKKHRARPPARVDDRVKITAKNGGAESVIVKTKHHKRGYKGKS